MSDYSVDQLRSAYQSAKAANDQQSMNAIFPELIRTAAASAPKGNYDPTEGQSGLENFNAGIGRGMVHTGASLGNLFGMVPDQTMSNLKTADAPLLNTTGGRWGNMAGEAAITAPLGMGAAGLVGNMGRLGAGIADSAIGNGMLQGGIQGAITADPGERLKNAALGTAAGGILPVAGATAGKVIKGLSRSPEAQTLLDEKISLTPGQMNPTGAMNQLEQAAESLMGAKQLIHSSRENAEQQYQAMLIGKGAAPGAKITPSENIHDMLDQAYRSYEPLYDQAKGFPMKKVIMSEGTDVPLSSAFASAANAPGVPKSLKESTNEWLQDRLTQLGKNPDSADILSLRSDIRTMGRKAKLSTDISSPHLETVYGRAERALTDALDSQLPDEAKTALRTADSNYGNYKILENAVAKSKDNIAGLTPQKLSNAIYEATEHSEHARGGGGGLRPLAQAGTQVFQKVSPPTGARVATLGVALAAAMHNPAITAGAALGGIGLSSTELGRLLAAGKTGWQQGAQRALSGVESTVPAYARNVGKEFAGRFGTAAGMPMIQGSIPAAAYAAMLLGQPAGH